LFELPAVPTDMPKVYVSGLLLINGRYMRSYDETDGY